MAVRKKAKPRAKQKAKPGQRSLDYFAGSRPAAKPKMKKSRARKQIGPDGKIQVVTYRRKPWGTGRSR